MIRIRKSAIQNGRRPDGLAWSFQRDFHFRRGHGVWGRLAGLGCALILAAGGGEAAEITPNASDSPEAPFQEIEALNRLGNEGTRRAGISAARVRGIVTAVLNPATRCFIQDGTNALVVALSKNAPVLQPGDAVEVEGTVQPGTWAPYIDAARIRALGAGTLPTPKQADALWLARGDDFARYVSLKAVVRDLCVHQDRLILLLNDRSLFFQAFIPVPKGFKLPEDGLDAVVEIRGACWTSGNTTGQADGFGLYCGSTNQVLYLRGGSTGPLFDRPRHAISELKSMKLHPADRVKVQGTVSLQTATQLFIEDSTGSLTVFTHPAFLSRYYKGDGQFIDHAPQVPLRPGDVVEVIGAPVDEPMGLKFAESEYRKTGEGQPPRVIRATIPSLASGRLDARTVSIRGRLLDHERLSVPATFKDRFTLEADGQIFEAYWEDKRDSQFPLTQSAYFEITGVASARVGHFSHLRTERILLREPGDLTPASPPPLWERSEVRKPLLAAGLVGLLSAAWILFQRWQLARLEGRVQTRTSELQGEVAARERAEEELRLALRAEKELGELRNSFVSMVSHQFRTPLGSILSSTEILDYYSQQLTPEKRQKHFRTIHEAVQRMAGLVDEVLIFNRSESGKMEFRPGPLDLEALCRKLIEEVQSATSRRCPIHLDIANGLTQAVGDESLLRHLLTNLLDNAVRYSPAGAAVRMSVTRQGPHARLQVIDQGAGIPEADLKKLFTAFHRGSNTRGTPGTGLGMVIAKRCVDRHGGRIDVQSKVGEGTTVTVTLPLLDPAVPAPSDRTPREEKTKP
ncbi:MAG: hypothetical protein HY299_01305 [Verrucomicrobia bacterium]|nr:hypothetical protein [Verrucomicrobiota bacterium]